MLQLVHLPATSGGDSGGSSPPTNGRTQQHCFHDWGYRYCFFQVEGASRLGGWEQSLSSPYTLIIPVGGIQSSSPREPKYRKGTTISGTSGGFISASECIEVKDSESKLVDLGNLYTLSPYR